MNINYQVSFKGMGGQDSSFEATAKERISVNFDQIEIPPLGDLNGLKNGTNKPVYVAGKMEWSPLILTFKVGEESNLYLLLQKQLEDQVKTFYDNRSTYPKFDIELTNEKEFWTIHDAFIESTDWMDMDASDLATSSVTVKFRFDHAKVETRNEKM